MTASPFTFTYQTLKVSLGLLLAFSIALAIWWGDIPLSDALSHASARWQGTSASWNPLIDERIPRILVIIVSGASLAASGAVMQALFQNPLASPGVLGLCAGGSLMVVCVFILGLHVHYPFAIPVAACTGSLLTLLLVYFLAKWHGRMHLNNLIMTGIAISTLLIAVQGAILYALRDQWQMIQALTEIEAASTLDRTWRHVHMQLPLAIIGLWGCWFYRREIDMMALGDEEARNLGVDVERIRWHLFLCIALLIGGAIAAIGMIAFVGLILPHLLRRLQGPENVRLIPLCILGGGAILLALDVFLRILAIQALTIGTVTAVLGGFLFLLLLMGDRSYSDSNVA